MCVRVCVCVCVCTCVLYGAYLNDISRFLKNTGAFVSNTNLQRCETIVEGNDTQCLYCCQYDGCNGEIVTVWPAAVIATDPPAPNKTGNASTNGK